MDIQKIPISYLKLSDYNPRKKLTSQDIEYQKIKRSIEEFGYVDPIIVNRDMTIIGGHQRYTVLCDLEYTELDCVVIDIEKTKEKALNIALNKIAGEWDMELLKDLLLELKEEEFNIDLIGFDKDEMEKLFNQSETIEDLFEGGAVKNLSENGASKVIIQIGKFTAAADKNIYDVDIVTDLIDQANLTAENKESLANIIVEFFMGEIQKYD